MSCGAQRKIKQSLKAVLAEGELRRGVGIRSLVVSQVLAGQHVTSVSTIRALRAV